MKTLPIILKRTPQAKPTAITGGGIKAAYGNNLILYLETDDPIGRVEIATDRRVLVGVLKKILGTFDLPDSPATAAANRRTPAVTAEIERMSSGWHAEPPATIAEGLARMKQSGNHAAYIADIEATLRPLLEEEKAAADARRIAAALDPAELFTPDGKPRRGAQTKVAAALGIKNAGGHRTRILKVLDQLAA